MNHARFTHIFSFLVRRMRNSSVDQTWTVSDCKWMCADGGLCVVLSFKLFKKNSDALLCVVCVTHESACVVYASSFRDYARDTRRPSVLMRRNWFETAHVHVRPLKPHLYITHERRTYHVINESRTFSKRACLDALRQ